MAGLAAGVIIYVVQLKQYGDTKYIITNAELIQKRGNRIVRSLPIRNIDYYYFSKPELYPRVKVQGKKDFAFPMTKGVVHEIIASLELIGIKPKNNK
jgi:hypothetical protein